MDTTFNLDFTPRFNSRLGTFISQEWRLGVRSCPQRISHIFSYSPIFRIWYCFDIPECTSRDALIHNCSFVIYPCYPCKYEYICFQHNSELRCNPEKVEFIWGGGSIDPQTTRICPSLVMTGFSVKSFILFTWCKVYYPLRPSGVTMYFSAYLHVFESRQNIQFREWNKNNISVF